MSLPILVVDTDNEFSVQGQIAWHKHNISTVRVNTMQEAIEKLLRETFFFVSINGNTVNYLPLLRIMSDVSTMPILIGVNDFTHEKQNEAYANGATSFSQLQSDPIDNVKSVLSFLQSLHIRNKLTKRTPKLITRGNLTVYIDYHKVFCNDSEIVFTSKEYKLLHYLLINPDITLTFGQIAKKIWKTEFVSNNAIWQIVYRLNNKLKEAGWNSGCIINFRGVGYRFALQNDI